MTAGKPKTFVATIILLVGLLAVGVLAFARQLSLGDVVTGMRTIGAGGAVWGLYVVMDGFFLGCGISVMATACIARFSRDRNLEAVARIAMPVAIACFLAAALSVVADQGRPLVALVNLSLFARPQSPFFVTFTTVGAVCLYGSLVHCVLARRPDLAQYASRPSCWRALQRLLAAGYRGSLSQRYRRQKVGFWMSLLMLPALLATLTALAIIFTARPGRPLFLMTIEVVAFLLLAGAGGLGLLVGAAALVGHFAGPDAGLAPRGYARLGHALLLTILLSLLSVIGAEIFGLRSSEAAAANYARALLEPTFAPLFWSEIASLFVAAALLWRAERRTVKPRTVIVAGVLALVAVFLQRYLLLVAWQTHGLSLPYSPGAYSPTWVEGAVALGIVSLCVLLLLPSVRLIPFAPLALDTPPLPRAAPDLRRTVVTTIWTCVGLVVATFGFLSCCRVGTEPFQDPILTASPVTFIAGLAMLATTGAVYELLPERGGGISSNERSR
jgi:molybdopterin-containing oxidoreductase family membrane subunit